MSEQTEALKLALEALEQIAGAMPFPVGKQAITAIREALAEHPAIKQDLTPEQNRCKFPLCQSEEYQQALAEQIKQEIYTGETSLPQQEPVYVYTCKGCKALFWENDLSCDCTVNGLFEFDRHVLSEDTSPPASKPLTDVQIKAMWRRSKIFGTNEEKAVVLARAIEAKLKEKNK